MILTTSLLTSSKYPKKYLELFFASNNFEITILSTPTFQTFIFFLYRKILFLLLLFYQISTLLYNQTILLSLFFFRFHIVSLSIFLFWRMVWIIRENNDKKWSLAKRCTQYSNPFYLLLFYHQNLLVHYSWLLLM